MSPSIAQATAWLELYKYLALFPIMVIEGPIITIIAGFLASSGFLNPYISYIVIVFGDLTGDCLYYLLGRFGRHGFIEHWGHFVGITTKRIKKLEDHFKLHTGKTLVLGKISHFIGLPILVTAGMAEISFKDFVWFNFLATLPKSLVLFLSGYYISQAYFAPAKYVKIANIYALIFVTILVLLYFVAKKLSRKFA